MICSKNITNVTPHMPHWLVNPAIVRSVSCQYHSRLTQIELTEDIELETTQEEQVKKGEKKIERENGMPSRVWHKERRKFTRFKAIDSPSLGRGRTIKRTAMCHFLFATSIMCITVKRENENKKAFFSALRPATLRALKKDER